MALEPVDAYGLRERRMASPAQRCFPRLCEVRRRFSRDYSCRNDRISSGVTLPSLFTSTLSKIRL